MPRALRKLRRAYLRSPEWLRASCTPEAFIAYNRRSTRLAFQATHPAPSPRWIQSVNVAAIPVLSEPFRLIPTSEIMLHGDAPKGTVVVGDLTQVHAHAYIAKEPRREGPPECVTEFLIARLAALVPVRVAETRLVRLPTTDRRDDVRFMSRRFNRADDRLVHGLELVARCMNMEPASVTQELPKGDEERYFYSVDTVVDILRSLYSQEPASSAIVRGFGRMLAFDALVGCMDRHSMNWGVLEHIHGVRPPRFAPLFDSARGLFWQYEDHELETKVRAIGRAAFVENYAQRCKALIAAPKDNSGDSSHFAVMRYVARGPHPLLTQEARRIVRAFQPGLARCILDDEFGSLLSSFRRDLIHDLLRHRHAKLRETFE